MECPACGRPAEPEHASCGSCGAVLRNTAPGAGIAEEEVLYRFGPMGVGISYSRPGLFVFTYQNCTEVIATTQRLCGIRTMPRFVFARHARHAGESVFSVPWSDVVGAGRADYLLNAALWIRYRAGDAVKDLGVEAGLFWRHHIRALDAIARRRRPDAFKGPGPAEPRLANRSEAP